MAIIRYNMNGHGGVPEDSWTTYNHESKLPYTPSEPVARGYEFRKWNPGSIDDNQPIVDVLFNAVWNPIPYRINWNMNGHGSIPWNAPKTYTIESDTYVPDEPRENGWTFKGWTPESIPHKSIGDVTFTANWEQNTYVVTFKMDEYSEPLMSYTRTWNQMADECPPEPIMIGYRFDGWWTGTENGNKWAEDRLVKSNMTFYPHWIKND